MSSDRPPIPAPIKREVRQRCGYGCVICGDILYDYDHIEEYAVVQKHEADNLVLLCVKHHAEKTRKRLPKEKVIEANKSPYNLSKENTSPNLLHYLGDSIEVHLGTQRFINQNMRNRYKFTVVEIDEIDYLSFTHIDGELLLSFIAFDKDNNKILEVVENELIHSTGVWDAEWTSNSLIIREGKRRILLKVSFEVPNILKIESGQIYHNGELIEINKDGLKYERENSSFQFVGTGSVIADIGFSVDSKTGNVSIAKTRPQRPTINLSLIAFKCLL